MMNKIKNLMRCFKKIWDDKPNTDELRTLMIEKLDKEGLFIEEREEERIAYLDGASILAFIPKKTTIKKLIEDNFVVSQKKEAKDFLSKMPYKMNNFGEVCSKYDGKYLSIIFTMTKGYDNVKLKFKKDSPLFVETKDFILLLAPRVEEEE